MNFRIDTDPQIVIPPNNFRELEVFYVPSSLGATEATEIHFISE